MKNGGDLSKSHRVKVGKEDAKAKFMQNRKTKDLQQMLPESKNIKNHNNSIIKNRKHKDNIITLYLKNIFFHSLRKKKRIKRLLVASGPAAHQCQLAPGIRLWLPGR